MNKPMLMAIAMLCSAEILFPVTIQAAEAPVRSAPLKEVSPRDLMTFSERFDMWHKMRMAQTPEERLKLREQKYAELQKRASAEGLVLRDHGPMMMGNGLYGHSLGWRWHDRMGMRGSGYCIMYAHPPLIK